MAFKIAGSMALREGAREAQPTLLEPIMKVEVVTPEDYMGDVVGDLNRRRGLVQGMEDGYGSKIVQAEVPMAEMFGYSTDLRSATQVEPNTPWSSRATPRCRTPCWKRFGAEARAGAMPIRLPNA